MMAMSCSAGSALASAVSACMPEREVWLPFEYFCVSLGAEDARDACYGMALAQFSLLAKAVELPIYWGHRVFPII